MHDPGEEPGDGLPVATGPDPPAPETIPLVDFDRATFAAAGALSHPVVRAVGFDVVAAVAFEVIALHVDDTLAAALRWMNSLGGLVGWGTGRRLGNSWLRGKCDWWQD